MIRTTCLTLLAVGCLSLSACEEGWTEESQDTFRSQCKTEAGGMFSSGQQTSAYCECNLEVMKQHFSSPQALNERQFKSAADSAQIHKQLEDCSVKARQ